MTVPTTGTIASYLVDPRDTFNSDTFTFPHRVVDERHVSVFLDDGTELPPAGYSVVGVSDVSSAVQVYVRDAHILYAGRTLTVQRIVPPVRRSLEVAPTGARALNDEFRTVAEVLIDNPASLSLNFPVVWQANTPYTALKDVVFATGLGSFSVWLCITTTTGDATFPTAKFSFIATVSSLILGAAAETTNLTVNGKVPPGAPVLTHIISNYGYIPGDMSSVKCSLPNINFFDTFIWEIDLNGQPIGAVLFTPPTSITAVPFDTVFPALIPVKPGDVLSITASGVSHTNPQQFGVTITIIPSRVLPGAGLPSMATAQTYTCNGPTQFAFPYPVLAANQLTLSLNPGGVVSPSAYTVDGTGPQSTAATVNYPAAPTGSTAANPTYLTISRNTPATQQTVLSDLTAVTASVLNAEFANLYGSIQDGAFTAGFAAPVVWTANIPYQANYSLVIYQSKLYKCTVSTTGDATFPTSKFSLLYDLTAAINGSVVLNVSVSLQQIVPSTTVLVFNMPNQTMVYTGTTDPFMFLGWQAFARVFGTTTQVFSVQKNGVQFATITFQPFNNLGVFAAVPASSSVVLLQTDVLTVVCPATADATLAGIGMTLSFFYTSLP